MINLTLLSMILIPALVYQLSRKSVASNEVLPDYIVPPDVEVRSCATHWSAASGITRVNRGLLSEIKCHPDYVEHDVPEVWFKWTPADARKRARLRATADNSRGVLSIRKHA